MKREARLAACRRRVWWREMQIPEIEWCSLPPHSEAIESDDWMLLSIGQGRDGDEVAHG